MTTPIESECNAAKVTLAPCPRCKVDCPRGQRFCGECGNPLDLAFADMKQYLSYSIREELRSILKSDYKDQNYLEIITTQAIVERITSWAKVFASFVAVPVAVLIAVLGFIGIKTYNDFTSDLNAAQKSIEAKLTGAQSVASKLHADGIQISNDYNKLKDGLNSSKFLAEDVERLNAQYKKLAASLDETAALNDKIKRLDAKVTGLADSLRTMLSVGNSDYRNVVNLRAPTNDAKSISSAFIRIGYKVNTRLNLTRVDMLKSIANFVDSISPGDTAIFYYSGHGVELNGINYLMPIDISSNISPNNIEQEGISLNDFIYKMQESNARVVVIILDACRNNPFVNKTRGLGRVTPPPGIFILYSASPGQYALDTSSVDGAVHSLFTQALISVIEKKNLSANEMAEEVTKIVFEESAKLGINQRPSYFGATLGPVYLAGR